MTPRSLAAFGAVALAGLGTVGLGALNALLVENTAPSIAEHGPTPAQPAVATTAPSTHQSGADDSNPPAAAPAAATPAAPSPVEASTVETVLTDPGPKPTPNAGMQLASASPSEPADDGVKAAAGAIEPSQQCATDSCVDAYLWSLYERTPKIDMNKVTNEIKVKVKKKGKTRTVTQTVVTYVVDDFTWKDPDAAQRAGMSLMDYVIGGMDPGFKLKLYNALHAMDDAGLMPGITSAFRDDYRQAIASGNKAASDSSYHGGSKRGGYRHGLAADLVSVKGDTRTERYAASEVLWKWIDAHGQEYGVGRPYLDRDPPHVGPIDGTEYIVKRGLANEQAQASETKAADKPKSKAKRQLAGRPDSGARKHAKPIKFSKLSSLEKRASLRR
jgi:hypothetical protein